MDIVADLLVVVIYCLGVYTLLAVVAGLFEWWDSRLRRTQRGSTGYSLFGNRRAPSDGKKAADRSEDLSGVFSP